MKRVASLVSRAVLAALLLTSVFGGIARADDGGFYRTAAFDTGEFGTNDSYLLPEDPGVGP